MSILANILTTQFSKGVVRAAIYYAVAFALAWLTYKCCNTYIHGPGLHHAIGFLALAGGTIWIIVGVIKLLLNKQDKQNIGSLLINIVVVTSVGMYVVWEINRVRVFEATTNKDDNVTVIQDTSTHQK